MKPHQTDLISLTFGLIFLAAANLWLLIRLADLQTPAIGWLVVAALIVLGMIGITQALVSTARRGRDDQSVSDQSVSDPNHHPK
ncbi:MAG TPA: hypothetical protein VIL37_15025 [Natronosporangium sp.]